MNLAVYQKINNDGITILIDVSRLEIENTILKIFFNKHYFDWYQYNYIDPMINDTIQIIEKSKIFLIENIVYIKQK